MASAVVERLRERRLNIAKEMEDIAKLASEENRNFSGDEQGKWEKLNEDYDQVQAREQAAMEQEERSQAADASFEKLYGKSGSGDNGAQRSGTEGARSGATGQESEELRKFLQGNGPRYFDVMPPKGTSRMFESRATLTGTLLEGGATTGGDTVPTGFYNRLVEHLINNAAIMQAGVTVINTAGGNPIPVPKTTQHSGGAIVAEGSAIGEDDPAFGQVTLNAYKYGMLVKVSRELVDDTGVDLLGYLAREAGQALGNAFGAHAMIGDGSSKPRGVLTDALLGLQAADDVFAPTYDDLVDMFHSVIAPYRKSPSCYWVMNDATIGTIRKLVADGSGIPLWQPSVQLGAPDLLLSKPVITDPNLDVTGVTDKKPILFGDFSRYFVRLAGGIRFERSDDYAFNSDMVTFRALMRADGALVDLTGAVKYYETGDTGT